ncbi:MAG: hypothetical protein KGL39_25575 [Patescibacteria group bacterium]|nr:hypothetical protein [Patescibacteria group bacterium]
MNHPPENFAEGAAADEPNLGALQMRPQRAGQGRASLSLGVPDSGQSQLPARPDAEGSDTLAREEPRVQPAVDREAASASRSAEPAFDSGANHPGDPALGPPAQPLRGPSGTQVPAPRAPHSANPEIAEHVSGSLEAPSAPAGDREALDALGDRMEEAGDELPAPDLRRPQNPSPEGTLRRAGIARIPEIVEIADSPPREAVSATGHPGAEEAQVDVANLSHRDSPGRITPPRESALPNPATPVERPNVNRGTLRGRGLQLLRPEYLQHEPHIRFVEGWTLEATQSICNDLTDTQNVSVSIPAMSRIAALNFERAHPNDIPQHLAHMRLLPPEASKKAYYEEMIKAFLEAIGHGAPEDFDAILQSFTKSGLGGLHRRDVAISGAIGSALGVGATAAPDPISKTTLNALQALQSFFTSKVALNSGRQRFRNSGTEEIMPAGRADATPSAKTGPSMLRAALNVCLRMHPLKKDVARISSSLEALHAARENLEGAATEETRRQAEQQLDTADRKLAVAYARFCYRSEIRADYKTAAESLKIELRGSQRYTVMSAASSIAGLSSTAVSVVPAALIAAPVTAGVSAGVLALTAALYVGYQLSQAPSKDGEDKAKRAIVALTKSMDFVDRRQVHQQRARMAAYLDFKETKRAAAHLPMGQRASARAAARATLEAQLREIALNDDPSGEFDALENWKNYAEFRARLSMPGSEPNAIKSAYSEENAEKFNSKALLNAWKTPQRMRLDSSERLISGALAESLSHLAKASNNGSVASQARRANLRAAVKDALVDHIHFGMMRERLQLAQAQADANEARAISNAAAEALLAVRNPQVHALFCGDAHAQVEATRRAKAFVAGEQERYTYTNAATSALGIAAGTSSSLASLAITSVHDVGFSLTTPNEPAHQKDATAFAQIANPATSPYASADRARFQKSTTPGIFAPLRRPGNLVSHAVSLPGSGTTVDPAEQRTAEMLETFLDELERTHDVPDQIEVTVGERRFVAKLNNTTPYFSHRYRTSSLAARLSFQGKRVAVTMASAAAGLASPLVQSAAQVPLNRTRRAARAGEALSAEAREVLSSEAKRNAEPLPVTDVARLL